MLPILGYRDRLWQHQCPNTDDGWNSPRGRTLQLQSHCGSAPGRTSKREGKCGQGKKVSHQILQQTLRLKKRVAVEEPKSSK